MKIHMLKSACIGFCRNNEKHELGGAIKSFLKKEISEIELLDTCKRIRTENWKTQQQHGIDIIPSNDFSMYDKMLDTTCLLGNIQRRFYWEGGRVPLNIFFTMAHGQQKDKFDVLPLEIQNWLNTNYLYFVPEFIDPIDFSYSDNKPIVEFLEAKQLGINTRSVILGPISYLMHGKSKEPDIKPLDLLPDILPIYNELFLNYKRIGIHDVQIDEPAIGFDLSGELKDIFTKCYNKLREFAGNDIELNFVSYYGDLHENFDFIATLPVNSIHIDVPNNKQHIQDYIKKMPDDKKLSLGIVDGRNIWVNNLEESIEIVSYGCEKKGTDNIIIANSAPLFICPYSVKLENDIKPDIKRKMAFAVEKLEELRIIKDAINKGKSSVKDELKENKEILKDCNQNTLQYKPDISAKQPKKTNRWQAFLKEQKLPVLPTMIAGRLSNNNCEANDENQEISMDMQEKAGLDVISCSAMNNVYDISNIAEKTDGVLVLKNNPIPRYGCEYYNPAVIYDYPKFQKNIFVKTVNECKKKTKKTLKFSICSPLHFLNFAFINPCLDCHKIKQSVKDSLLENINSIAEQVDILQFNELSFTANIDIQTSKNLSQIKMLCKELNEFITKIKNIKCIALYTGYLYLNDIIEDLCHINADILMAESARSGHELMQTFISYKPPLSIGFGVFDSLDNRTPSRSEMINAGKKALMCVEMEQAVLVCDGDFFFKKDKKITAKSLKTLADVAVILRKK